MYQIVFLLLKQRLSALNTLRYIDIFTGQFDNLSTDPTADLPAALIEFRDWQTSDQGRLIQKLEGSLVLHLFSYIPDTFGKAIETKANAHFAIDRNVYKALQGHSAKLSDLPEFATTANSTDDHVIFNALSRTSASMRQEYGPFFKTEQTYRFTTTDFSATPAFEKIEAQLIPTVGLLD